jgi:hypothetical protein
MRIMRRRFLQAAGTLVSAALHPNGAVALADESWCDVDSPVGQGLVPCRSNTVRAAVPPQCTTRRSRSTARNVSASEA